MHSAEDLQDLAKEGYKDLSAEELVAFRIHHIDSEFIENVKKAGHQHPTPNQLVEFKIMGVRRRSAELAAEVKKDAQVRVAIKADKRSPFGEVVKVLDAAKAANVSADRITAITEKPGTSAK